MIKIALIEPNYEIQKTVHSLQLNLPPLWMLSIGTHLKYILGNNLEILFLDGQILKPEKILKKLESFDPDFVGISPKYTSYESALTIARFVKQRGAKVVMGGAHASFLSKEILLNRGSDSDDYCVDAVIQGDGEKAFHEYIIGRKKEEIKNLIFIKGRNVVENKKEYLNLDSLLDIDRNIIRSEEYFLRNKVKWRVFPVYSHKGCFSGNNFNKGCVFCGSDKKLRKKSPEMFWKEIDILVKRHQASHISNFADGFPLDLSIEWVDQLDKASSLCKKKPQIGLRTLPNFINKKSIKLLKKINVFSVRMPITGVFPGCAFSLNKGPFKQNEFEKICRPFKLLSEAGIIVSTYLKPGALGESDKDIGLLIKLSKLLSSYKNVNVIFARGFVSFPGSRGWNMILDKTGLKYKNRDLIDWHEIGRDWAKHYTEIKSSCSIEKLNRVSNKTGDYEC